MKTPHWPKWRRDREYAIAVCEDERYARERQQMPKTSFQLPPQPFTPPKPPPEGEKK